MSDIKVYNAKISVSINLRQIPRDGYSNYCPIEFEFSEKTPAGLDPVTYLHDRINEEIERALKNNSLMPWCEPIETIEPKDDPKVDTGKDDDIPF